MNKSTIIPRSLHEASCDKCGMKVLSNYPKGAEIYCDECYLKEVY